MFGFGFSFSACSVMFKIVHHNSLNHIHRVKRFSRLKKKKLFCTELISSKTYFSCTLGIFLLWIGVSFSFLIRLASGLTL